MFKILGAILIAMMMMGAGCTDTKYQTEYIEVPAEPVQPVQPIEPVEPPDEVPGVGTSSLSYNPTCESGFARVEYVYRDTAGIDSNSFVILHSADGKNIDTITSSAFSNGSVYRMEEEIYIQENDGDKQVAHKVDVSFISSGVSRLQSFSFIQPPCEVIEEDEAPPVEVSVML